MTWRNCADLSLPAPSEGAAEVAARVAAARDIQAARALAAGEDASPAPSPIWKARQACDACMSPRR